MKIEQLRHLALSLPEATETPHFAYTSFRVRGKIFATAPPDGAHVHLFLPESTREPALALHSAFLEKLLWGGKVVGVRARLAAADEGVMARLLRQAWVAKAPKKLQSAAD